VVKGSEREVGGDGINGMRAEKAEGGIETTESKDDQWRAAPEWQ
jgi:hypothetical protein